MKVSGQRVTEVTVDVWSTKTPTTDDDTGDSIDVVWYVMSFGRCREQDRSIPFVNNHFSIQLL